MFIDSLKKVFHSNDHKEIMIAGLYLSSIVIFLLLGIVAGLMGYETIFWIKLGIVILSIILLYGFLKSGKVQLYAIFLLFIVEIDSAYVMLYLHSGNFVTIYPFFVIFGFFFFFKLRAAVWMVIAHLFYWLLISVYGHFTFSHDPAFQVIPLSKPPVLLVDS